MQLDAGGVVIDDVVRSLTISQPAQLGTRDVFVAAHASSGFGTFTDDREDSEPFST